ncbi:MAG: hypothetical protein K2H73_07655, partial [Treponemataceae bacterium]|nr:hypothetical protein [Treponemataceae bacterium]
MKIIRIVALLCAVAAFVACKSTEVAPEPQPEPVVEPTPESEPEPEPSLDFSAANQALLEKLDAAREKAVEADA